MPHAWIYLGMEEFAAEIMDAKNKLFGEKIYEFPWGRSIFLVYSTKPYQSLKFINKEYRP